jgi:hypothetical protein
MWLASLGGVLVTAGLVIMVLALRSSGEQGPLTPLLRGLMALVGGVVPGLIYLACAYFIPRRHRWAIGAADITTWLQLFFAGAMAILSILQIKLLWPWMIIGLLWAIPLLLTPRFTAPCGRAMDLIAQIPVLGVQPARPKSRTGMA